MLGNGFCPSRRAGFLPAIFCILVITPGCADWRGPDSPSIRGLQDHVDSAMESEAGADASTKANTANVQIGPSSERILMEQHQDRALVRRQARHGLMVAADGNRVAAPIIMDAPCRPGQVFKSHCRPSNMTHGCDVTRIFNPQTHQCKSLQDLVSGQLLIDVGLNVPSDWTFHPAARSRNVSVIGFEPIPESCHQGQHFAHANRLDVDVRCKAVADFVGTAHFHVNQKAPARSTFSEMVVAGLGLNTTEVVVNVTTLDDELTRDEAARVSILKTDTQGHEVHVLRGARNLLKRGNVKLLFVEFDPWLLRKSGTDEHALLEEVHASGFTCYIKGRACIPIGGGHTKCWNDMICARHSEVTSELGQCGTCEDVKFTDWVDRKPLALDQRDSKNSVRTWAQVIRNSVFGSWLWWLFPSWL